METACGAPDGNRSQIETIEQPDFDGTVGHQLSDFIVRQVLGQIVRRCRQNAVQAQLNLVRSVSLFRNR